MHQAIGAGTELRLSGRTTVALSGQQARIDYGDGEVYDGTVLANALNGVTNGEQIQLRYRLTSLTTFLVNADAVQDRFQFDPLRNANSIRVMPGFDLKPAALISGLVLVGFRQFTPLDPRVEPFRGPVAAVEARTTVRSRTQLGVKVNRDITFSYKPDQPYFVQTSVDASITQRLTPSWDVVVHAGRLILGYSRIKGAALVDVPGGVATALPDAPAQRDVQVQYGGGIGYRFGRIVRLGIDGSYNRRVSTDVNFPPYEGLRVGASVSYGLPQ
jgi:hypothetical protein